jgi:hypothetical protein
MTMAFEIPPGPPFPKGGWGGLWGIAGGRRAPTTLPEADKHLTFVI